MSGERYRQMTEGLNHGNNEEEKLRTHLFVIASEAKQSRF